MKRIIGIIFLSILYHSSNGQQQGQFSQYMLNYYLINPAVAGSDNDIDLKTSFRKQWTGVDGAPVNYYLSGHTVLGRVYNSKRPKPKQAIGFIFTGQELGPFKRNGLYVSYAYHYPISNSTYISIGASAGGLNYQLNTSRITFSNSNPDAAAQNLNNQFKFDANAGVFLYNKKMFAGVSSMQLLENKLQFSDSSTVYGNLKRHIYILGGYNININEDLTLVPSVLLKYVASAAFQFDINAKIKYQNKYWCGVSYRKQDAIVILAGLRISDFLEFGYSYDLTTSALKMGSKGTHEIVLGARFKRKTATVCPSDFW